MQPSGVYEGITDDAEAGRLVRESFLPLLEHVQGSSPITGSTPATA